MSGKRRKVQSATAARIDESLQKRFAYPVVAGDFNDYPDGAISGTPWALLAL